MYYRYVKTNNEKHNVVDLISRRTNCEHGLKNTLPAPLLTKISWAVRGSSATKWTYANFQIPNLRILPISHRTFQEHICLFEVSTWQGVAWSVMANILESLICFTDIEREINSPKFSIWKTCHEFNVGKKQKCFSCRNIDLCNSNKCYYIRIILVIGL